MANYKMILQYDGTRYRGWQVLPAELTIQGKLQDVLSKMAGYQVEVTGSGRTDAGVHAKGQTANFHLREEWDEDKILFYLNQYLPEDIPQQISGSGKDLSLPDPYRKNTGGIRAQICL